MAFGRLRSSTAPQAPMHAINITPLVDVMLVLVVVFIMAAPMLAAGLRLQLPSAQGTQPLEQASLQTLRLQLDAQGQLLLQGEHRDATAVQQALAQWAADQPQGELQLMADAAVPYGRVVEVMGWAHAAGLRRIGFVSTPLAPATAP